MKAFHLLLLTTTAICQDAVAGNPPASRAEVKTCQQLKTANENLQSVIVRDKASAAMRAGCANGTYTGRCPDRVPQHATSENMSWIMKESGVREEISQLEKKIRLANLDCQLPAAIPDPRTRGRGKFQYSVE